LTAQNYKNNFEGGGMGWGSFIFNNSYSYEMSLLKISMAEISRKWTN